MITEAEFKKLKQELEEEQASLIAQLKKLRQPEATEMGGDVDHLEEEADEAEEMSTSIGLQKTFKERLENIKATLFKMGQGTYGVCEKCGNEIDIAVLNADPESRWCRVCKAR